MPAQREATRRVTQLLNLTVEDRAAPRTAREQRRLMRSRLLTAALRVVLSVSLVGCTRSCTRHHGEGGSNDAGEIASGPLVLERSLRPNVTFERALAWGVEGQELFRLLLVEHTVECSDVTGAELDFTNLIWANVLHAPAQAGTTLSLHVAPVIADLETQKEEPKLTAFVMVAQPTWNVSIHELDSLFDAERAVAPAAARSVLGAHTKMPIRWVVKAPLPGAAPRDLERDLQKGVTALRGVVDVVGCGMRRSVVAPRVQAGLDFHLGERKVEIRGARLRYDIGRPTLELSSGPLSCDRWAGGPADVFVTLKTDESVTDVDENFIDGHPDAIRGLHASIARIPDGRVDAIALARFRVSSFFGHVRHEERPPKDAFDARAVERHIRFDGTVEALDCTH